MRLLEKLYELGLYVESEEEVKQFIAEHPEVIDDLAYVVEELMKSIPRADYLLYVDGPLLILNAQVHTYRDYTEILSLLPYLHPLTDFFQIEISVPSLKDEID